ncbi:MAG: hydroxymethylbilane synthase [Caulobacteraceae bacterium]
MSRQAPVRIGARASALSQAQTRLMQARIATALGAAPEEVDEVCPIVLITTTGDRIQDRRLLEAGGKGLFVKEIEEALLDGRIDCAIHSMKDMPAELPPGLVIAAVPEREDPADAFVSRLFASFDDLPHGARLGTASLRRQAQSLARRPDLKIEMLRGNVDTRLRRLEDGDFEAILLAAAGLNRLGRPEVIRERLDPIAAPPAPGQGALAIQTREADAGAAWLKPLHDHFTETAVAAERGAMLALEGSCRTAIGAHARFEGDGLHITVEALTADGRERFRREGFIPAATVQTARAEGLRLGEEIRAEAGPKLLTGQ